MTEFTAAQLAEIAEQLESAPASVLGRLLFAFSSLDTELGLMLVWVKEGRELEALTEKIADYGFHKLLTLLEKLKHARTLRMFFFDAQF